MRHDAWHAVRLVCIHPAQHFCCDRLFAIRCRKVEGSDILYAPMGVSILAAITRLRAHADIMLVFEACLVLVVV